LLPKFHDFFLTQPGLPDFYLEVKNVHWKQGEGALFPDSPTTRGVKHLKALTRQVQKGDRAAVLYVVQRPDVATFGFAAQIDPLYANAAQDALDAGVEMWAYACVQDSHGIFLDKRLPEQTTA
jgi:sugar fermentation stimulation protein A